MTKILKAGALWLAITAIVWLFTIWHWQTSSQEATNAEIVGQLFALPVALTVFFLLVLWGVQHLRAQAAAPVPAPQTVSSNAAVVTTTPAASDESPNTLSAWVLAEAVMMSTGADASAAWQGLQSRSIRPELDSELQDMDGMPIFTSRVPDLDIRDWLDAHAELAQGEVDLPVGVVRGLALLEAPLHQMLSAVGEAIPVVAPETVFDAPAAADQERGMKAHLSGVAAPVSTALKQAKAAMSPQLTVRLLLPSSWDAKARETAVAWIRSQCGSLLDWAETVQAKGVRWSVDALERPEDLWEELDRQMVQWSRDPRPELWLILAVDSAINEVGIERMQAVGELFTSSHQTGKVPGEAAAGLLLANEQWPTLALQAQPPVRMWRPVRALRDKSADAAGRVGSGVLGGVLQHALSLNQADKDRLLVVADADHRASRTAELFEALQDVMPGVDPMLAVTRVGESCGDLGVARVLVPSALACAALRSCDKPDQVAVATHVQSSHDRVAVALAPWCAEPLAV